MRAAFGAMASLLLGCAAAEGQPVTAPPHPGGHAHHGQGMHHRFDGAEGWAKVFDAEDRDAWQKPEEVLAAMELTDPETKVADVGAGTGYFVVKIARRLPAGRVFAVDVEPDMVRYLRERAAREGLSNVSAVLAAVDDPKIPEPVDVILIVDTLHHIARGAYMTKLRAALRPGGRIVVVDFLPEATMGPPKEHRLSAEDVASDAKAAGLVVLREARLPQQYVLVLTPAR